MVLVALCSRLVSVISEPELVQRIPRTIAVIPVECRPASKLIFSTNANAKVLVVEVR